MDAQDRQESVDNSFRYVVGSILDDGKPFSGRADSLVMGAVYGKISSVEPAQKGAGQGVAGMDLILAGILVQGVGGEILDDAAAEKDIDNLHSLADTQNRAAGSYKGVQHGKLLSVQHRVDYTGAVIRLPEQDRINIPAAWKKQGVKGTGLGYVGKGGAGGPQLCEGVMVIVRIAGKAGDRYFFHV